MHMAAWSAAQNIRAGAASHTSHTARIADPLPAPLLWSLNTEAPQQKKTLKNASWRRDLFPTAGAKLKGRPRGRPPSTPHALSEPVSSPRIRRVQETGSGGPSSCAPPPPFQVKKWARSSLLRGSLFPVLERESDRFAKAGNDEARAPSTASPLFGAGRPGAREVERKPQMRRAK